MTISVLVTKQNIETKTPLELFAELYMKQNGSGLTDDQEKFMEKLIAEVWEDEK